jgi:hypothetical protein
MNEMSNADFICLLNDYPDNHEDVFMEAARRIANLTKELEAWKAAADNGSACDTPEGLAAFINDCNC